MGMQAPAGSPVSPPDDLRARTGELRPEQQFYVTPDDQVAVGIRNALAGVQVHVDLRIWRPTGDFATGALDVTPASDRALRYTFQPLAPGQLVAVSAAAVGATLPRRGQTYVTLQLIRAPTSAFRMTRWLAADYLSGSTSAGWPYGRTTGATEGQGMLYSIAGSAPAAGADWSQTVPANARWRIRGIRASLATAVAVANRRPRLIVDDGANTLLDIDTNVVQAASLTVAYDWIPGYPSVTTSIVETEVPLPGDLQLFPGWRIRSSTDAIQAADQWTAPRLLVEEWLED